MRNPFPYMFAVLMLGAFGPNMSWSQATATLEDLRRLPVRAEDWCSRYNRSEYAYPREIEIQVVRLQGGLYSPYDGTCFRSRRESDIEHLVALAEAHRSGMCSRSETEKSAFASDPLNLTLATPELNRGEKIAKDAAEWLPEENRCWFAHRVIQVKTKYGLSVDKSEARALQKVLRKCNSTQLITPQCRPD